MQRTLTAREHLEVARRHPNGRVPAVKRWPSAEAKSWTLAAIQHLASDPNVAAVVAVGSSVRDTSSSADVDFVIIYAAIKPRLEHTPLDVDIRFYDRDSVEDLLATGSDYLVWALRLGVPVVQRDGYWDSLRREWYDKAPWPDPCESENRARKAEKYHHDLLAAGDEDAAKEQYVSMLTHLARARLLRDGVFPASRPELPDQLDSIGAVELASELRRALAARAEPSNVS